MGRDADPPGGGRGWGGGGEGGGWEGWRQGRGGQQDDFTISLSS